MPTEWIHQVRVNVDTQLNLSQHDEAVVMAFFTFLEGAPLNGLDGDIGILDHSLEQRASKVDLDQARKGGSKQDEEHLVTDYVDSYDYFNEIRNAIYTGMIDVHYAGGHRLVADFMRGEMLKALAFLQKVSYPATKDPASAASEPAREEYNSLLGETAEMRRFKFEECAPMTTQSVLTDTATGTQIRRSLECIQLMVQPMRQPHALMWSQALQLEERMHLPSAQTCESEIWIGVLRDTNMQSTRENAHQCALCSETCDETCLGIKCIAAKPPAYIYALKRILMVGVTHDNLKAWHPAITSMSPITSLAVMSYSASNKTMVTLSNKFKPVMIATEAWHGEIEAVSKSLQDALHMYLHIRDYSVEQEKNCGADLAEQPISLVTRLSVADEHGRMVVDELFHPTKACKLNLIADAMQDVTTQLTQDIPYEVYQSSEHYDQRLMEQLRSGGGFVKIHAGRSGAAINLHTKMLKSGDSNINTLAYVEPHLISCSASRVNRKRIANRSRMCCCTAYEAYFPDTPKLWICWDYREAMKIGSADPNGQVLPFLLSTYMPVMYLVKYPGDTQPTQQKLMDMKNVGFSLTRAYELIVGTPREMELCNYRRCLQSNWRVMMMAEIFKVARKFHERHDMIFDTMQMDPSEEAFRCMLRVHSDPATGAMRPWYEHEDVYANLTNKSWRQIISQLARYQVPRALHETFCRLPTKHKTDPNISVEAAPLMHEQTKNRQQASRQRMDEFVRNKPLVQMWKDRFPNRVMPVSGVMELQEKQYKGEFVKRPILSLQDPPTPRHAGTGAQGQGR